MARVSSPIFVGRTTELAALDDALDRAAAGQVATVLIGGDPGVGKTRLLQAWNEGAVRRGARIAIGSCLDLGDAGPAYIPVVEALRDLLRRLDPGEEERLVGGDRSVLGRILPELDPASGLDGSDEASSGLGQTRLFDRLVDIFHRSGATMPLVLELEDIHWADRSSQAFLLYLVEVARDANLLVIGTYRPEAADVDPAFRTTLGQLLRRPRVTSLPVAPFDAAELREQLTGILGKPPTTALLDAIRARSEGNPLFAEELAAAHDPAAHLPASIAAATATKVEALSDDARHVLRVASVVGRTANYDVLRAASELDDQTLANALREAVRAGLLEPHHVGEAYRFRHALLQDAIYDETLPGERRRLHGAVAMALSIDPDRPPDDPVLAPRLARHWFEAGDLERAFLASLAAATASEQQSAYAEAATHFERALELWDRAGDKSMGLSRPDALERAAWTALLAGDFDRSVALGRASLTEMGPTPDRSRAIRVLDVLERAEWRAGVDAREAMAALAAMDPEGLPPADRITVQIHRVIAMIERGPVNEAFDLVEPLLEEARATGSFRLHAHATMLFADLGRWSDPDDALEILESVQRQATESGDDVNRTDIDVITAGILLDARMFDRLMATVPEAVEKAGRSGLGRWGRPQLRFTLAHGYLLLGDLSRSLEQVELARMDAPTGRIRALLELVGALAATAAGGYGDAAEHLEASRLPNSSPDAELGRGWLATARAQLALAEGRLVDVRDIIEATAPRVLAPGVYTEMSDTIWSMAEVGLAALADEAERARAANDAAVRDSVIQAMERLQGWVDEVRRQRDAAGRPELAAHGGSEAMIKGHVARIEGRDDPELWAAAVTQFQEGSIDAHTARYRQAEAMLATRMPREQVREVMVLGHAAAVRSGARPLVEQFEALARRARIDLRPNAAEAGSGQNGVAQPEPFEDERSSGHLALRKRGLSDREIEVLTLVAAGFSNTQIAERLFISRKTASVHVSHIMNKLGVGSRTEAATISVRLGLPEVS